MLHYLRKLINFFFKKIYNEINAMLAAGRTNSGKVVSIDSMPIDLKTNVQSNAKDNFDVLNPKKNEASCYVKVPSGRNVCYKCSKPFPSKEEVIMHLKLIHNACATVDCSKISDFKMHSSVCANRGFGCTICNMKFTEKCMLFMHFNEHIGAAFYVCDICRDGFQQRKDLQRHLLHIHQKNICVPVIPSHSKPVYQKCGQCLKYYRLFAEFEEHTSSCCNSTVYACPICQIHFTTLSDLDEHKLEEHKSDVALKGNLALKYGKQYFCGVCYLGFSKGSTLKLHLETHDMEVSFICDVCHSRFTNDEDLQTHYLLHIEEHYVLHDVISQYSCNSCKKTFKTPEELKNHVPNCTNSLENLPVHSPSHLNSSCADKENTVSVSEEDNHSDALKNDLQSDVNSLDITDILIYVLKSGEDLLNCDDKQCIIVMDLQSVFVLQRGVCAAESRMPDVKDSLAYDENDAIDATLLQNHMFQILSPTNEEVSDVPSNSQMDTENFPFLDQDFNTESGAVEGMTANFDESIDDSQQNIVLGDNKMYSQFVPGVEDSINSENMKDMQEESTYETALNNSESSDINYEKSADVIIQENYVPYNNNDEISNVDLQPESSDTLSDMHVCNICKQVFSTKNSLCLHMKGSHTGFDCYRCGNSFKSDEDLKSHEKISHPNAFHCDLCEVSYAKEHLLKKHKRSAHGGKHFMCNMCDKSYVLKNEYDVHLLMHKGETPPTKCEICGKIYASVSNYMRHKAIHEGKNIPKKYKCTVCDKCFIARTPLQRHMSTHIRKSPLSYECPKCKMYFTPKQLAKHVESHHMT